MSEVHADARQNERDAEQSANRDPAVLVARIERLEDELDALRSRYRRIRRSQYRGTAIALAVIGVSAMAGAWLFPGSRRILLAFGGTGLFAAVLIYFLTPERFIAAETGTKVYEALATNQAGVVAELGLQDTRVYVPASGSTPSGELPEVRLFVPKHSEYEIPDDEALDSRFVITSNAAERGVTFLPSAAGLMTEFETTLSTGLSRSPSRLASQLVDGLVNGFELVETITPSVSPSEGRALFAVTGSAYGQVDRFDNPVPSFLAVGLARGLRAPVTVTVTVPGEGNSADFLVSCEWTPEPGIASPRPGSD